MYLKKGAPYVVKSISVSVLRKRGLNYVLAVGVVCLQPCIESK